MKSLSPRLFAGLRGRVLFNEPLYRHLAYRIGGPADVFIDPADEEELLAVLELCSSHDIPLTILSDGTNILVRDAGLRGVVLWLGSRYDVDVQVLQADTRELLLRVPARMPKSRLLQLALERSWAGLEFSAGIPGSLGGAVFMNAGTKWGAYVDVIERVRLVSAEAGIIEKSKEEMGFKYRGHGEGLLDGRTAVLSVDLRVRLGEEPGEIRARIDQILRERGSKQPLELPNCGSVFKNPTLGPGAGRLIEACGLKGHRVGQAMFSLKHANFILNLGGASASDVEELIETAQETVQREKGIRLEPEVIVLGSH